MLKRIGRKLLGKPRIVDDETFQKQSVDHVLLNLARLRRAMIESDTRKIGLLSLWLTNRGLQAPQTVTECNNEMLRLTGD